MGTLRNTERFIDRITESIEWVILVLGLLVLLGTAFFTIAVKPTDFVEATNILYGIGASLIAAAVATFVMSASRDRFVIRKIGVQRVYRRRSEVHEDEYRSFIKSAKQRIWVQGISLSRFISRNAQPLEEAALRGVDIRILVLSCDMTVNISNGLNMSLLAARDYEEKVKPLIKQSENYNHNHQTLQLFAKKAWNRIGREQKNPDNLRIKQYFSTASTMVFLIDDRLFFGPYLHLFDSGDIPTLYVEKGTFQDEVERHFRNLWDDDRFAIDLQKLTQGD